MSNIYIQEPLSSGKVLLETSIGDIDIELWSREAPKACRNFVQLCLEGYYDNTIFHRVIKGFIAQGGDPSGTGLGGDSIYGAPFKNEIHSRLRFVRRGLVALANTGNDDNGSQFFFTLGATPELQNKHTIFGKVAGDTIYNMIKFDELDTGSDDRPNFPPKIIRTEVLNNPFPDIVPRVKEEKGEGKAKKRKAKGVKNFKLLSFGSEAEDDENDLSEITTTSKKSKSIHDLIDDPTLSSEPSIPTEEEISALKEEEKQKELKMQELKDKFKTKIKETLSKAEESDSKKSSKKVSIEDLLGDRSKYEALKKNVKPKGSSREAATLQMLNKFKEKIDTLYSSKEEPTEGATDYNTDKWMVHEFKCDDRQLKLAKDANTKNNTWFDITDPRNEINIRKREDSSAALKKKI